MTRVIGWFAVGFGLFAVSVANQHARTAPNLAFLVGSFLPGLLFMVLGALLLRVKPGAAGEFVYDPRTPGRRAWAEAVTVCRRQAEMGILGGIVMLGFGTAITQLKGVEFLQAGTLLALAGWSFVVWGSARYMQYKGYSGWWGLFGMLVLLGLLILLCFPNRYRQRGDMKDVPNLTTGEVGAAEGAKIQIAELRARILPVLSVAWLAVAGGSALLFLILSRHDPTRLPALYGVGLGAAALAGALVRVTGRKRRHYALPTFAFLCLGVALAAPHRLRVDSQLRDESFKQAEREFEADLLALANQAPNIVLPPPRPTGDPRVDEIFQARRRLMNGYFGSLRRMNDRITALEAQDVYEDAVMTNAPALDAEVRKRKDTRTILEEHRAEVLGLFETEARSDAARRQRSVGHRALARIDSFDLSAEIASLTRIFSLRLRHVQAEADFLRFLRAAFGRYRVSGNTITFDTTGDNDQYAVLSRTMQDAAKALEAVQQRPRESPKGQDAATEPLAP